MADLSETLRKLGLAAARGVPQVATGFVDLAALPFTMTGLLRPEQAVGSTAYLTEKGLLPPEQKGLLGETTELVSSAVNPAMAGKAALAKTGLLAAPLAAGSIKNVFGQVDNLSLSQKATQALENLRNNPTSFEARQKYIDAKEALDKEFARLNKVEQPTVVVKEAEQALYRGEHSAPMKDSGKPIWDLSGIYPEDFYSSRGARFYGDGADLARDTKIVNQMQSFRNHPDRPITIYRAVPKDVPRGQGITTGDWVTLDRQYAKEHGQGALQGNYKIVKKTVRARDVFTNGDSIYEFGYDPQQFIPKLQR